MDDIGMQKWAALGLKLMGVYFAVVAIVQLEVALGNLASSGRVRNDEVALLFLPSATYLVAGVILTRCTDFCLRLAGFSSPK